MSSEILDEVNDFVKIWWDSFQEESSGRLRPAGGVGVSDAHGVSGVDYTGLTAWAKGNSVSTDQHTIHDFVEYFEMLFNRMKEFVVRKDVSGKATGIAGLTYKDFTRKGQLVAGRGSRKYQVGSPTDKAEKVEVLTCRLLGTNLLELYSDGATRALDRETAIVQELQTTNWECLHNDETFIRGRGIVHFLSTNSQGHVRLAESWEIFIRDHFGVPDGVPGAIAGSLQPDNLQKVPATTPKTMPYPIHYALAEAFAKLWKLEMRGLSHWGKNQLSVRNELCDIAHSKGTDTISLNEYYAVYRTHGVLHMADSELARSLVDVTRPNYILKEIPGSSPKQWTVALDPGLIRWRAYHRLRGRTRTGDGKNGEAEDENTSASGQEPDA